MNNRKSGRKNKLQIAVFVTIMGLLFVGVGIYLAIKGFRTGENNIVASLSVIAFGAIPIYMGMVDIIPYFKHKKQGHADINDLKNGMRITAQVVYVDFDNSIRINRQCPALLRCCYKDETTGFTYAFASESVFEDLNRYYKPGDPVFVYVDRNDFNIYRVDLDSYQKMGGPIVVDYTK